MTADASNSFSLAAPAKLNLGLRILGIRPDGYHLLDSLFVPLDLADEIALRSRDLHSGEAPGVDLTLLDETGDAPPGEMNLATRAAAAFLEASGLATRVEISLRKQIPVGAGLGGGSSDAAAVLRALDSRHPGAVAPEALFDLALGLGADVPFFLDPRPSFVGGIGEQIEAAPGIPGLALLLVNPGVSLATADVYAEFDRREGALTLAPSRPTLRPLVGQDGDEMSLSALEQWLTGGQLQNDLEAPAIRLCPEIHDLQSELRETGALAVGMSGSGATIFGVFSDLESAEAGRRNANFGSKVWARVAATAGSR